MALVREVPVLLALAVHLAPPVARAQSPQPWAGAGIQAGQEHGRSRLTAARRSAAAVAMRGEFVRPQGGATQFTVRVENISAGEVLELSNGKTAPFVSAPVLWVTHTGGTNPIFTGGKRDQGEGLERLAETGDPSKLLASLNGKPGVVAVGGVARPVGATTDGPLTPGLKYEFQISAQPGERLSTAWMFGQSNDLFYSNDRPIALFDASGHPVSGELTTQLSLWDAGSEVNEEPGLGPNQGPRQATPDAGVAESQGVAHVRDQYTYPGVGEVLRMTVTPSEDAVSSR
jgi:hypothetical protein